MINRSNFLVMQEYLDTIDHVYQRDPKTVAHHRVHLKHVLRWMGETALERAPNMCPVFPAYMATLELSATSVKRACQVCRNFFAWLSRHYPKRFYRVKTAWLETIVPPRMVQMPRERLGFVTLETVQKLCAIPADDMRTLRDKAGASFLYLSGCRASAFVSLPIQCVHIEARRVEQFPHLGVRTKNKKAAVTFLYDIPELLTVVSEWDSTVRPQLPDTAMWYTPIIHTWEGWRLEENAPGAHRNNLLNKGLRRLFALAELSYQSAHEFRRGHAVYGLKRANDMADLKAVSQNLMHESVAMTDSLYAILADSDVAARIGRLTPTNETGDVKAALRELLAKLEGR